MKKMTWDEIAAENGKLRARCEKLERLLAHTIEVIDARPMNLDDLMPVYADDLVALRAEVDEFLKEANVTKTNNRARIVEKMNDTEEPADTAEPSEQAQPSDGLVGEIDGVLREALAVLSPLGFKPTAQDYRDALSVAYDTLARCRAELVRLEAESESWASRVSELVYWATDGLLSKPNAAQCYVEDYHTDRL